MDFSIKLKNLRRAKNLSQTKLGNQVGVHYTQIGRYEKGLAMPTSEVLVKLAETLDTSIDYLMGNEASRPLESTISDKELLQQFQKIEQLDQEDKKVVKSFLDAFLLKKQIQSMMK